MRASAQRTRDHRDQQATLGWHRWRPWLRSVEKPARVAVQTAAAAIATFTLFKLTGLPQASWAVISALFVVQPNVGATIGVALGRIGGTALGTAIGLACIFSIGTSDWAIAVGLVLATGSVGFITGLRPNLRYGLVPAALILMGPGGEFVEQAWHGAAAICIGAVVGTLTGLIVFPATAHRDVERRLGKVLERSGNLLSASVRALLGEPEHDRVRTISADIETEIWAAGTVAAQSHYPSRLRRQPRHPRPRALLQATERLWHSLLLIMRADDEPLPEQVCDELAPALESFAAVGCDYLNALGRALAENTRPPSADPTSRCVQELNEALDRLRRRGVTRPLQSRRAEQVFALAFAIRELGRNFDEIACLFSGPQDRSGTRRA